LEINNALPPSLSTNLFALFGTDDIKFEEKHFPSTKILVVKRLSGKCAGSPALPTTLLLGLFHNTMVIQPPFHYIEN